MKIVWSSKAYQDLKDIENYILQKFGKIIRDKYILAVDDVSKTLSEMPNYGKIDPLFTNHKIPYRSIIINKLSKLVYYTSSDEIRIVAIWDTRKDPVKASSMLS